MANAPDKGSRPGDDESPLILHIGDIVEGRRPMPEPTAKRHHYLPQFVLRRFGTATPGDVSRLFQLDRRSGQPRKVTSKDAGFEKNLYTVIGDDGQPSRLLEGALSIVEQYAAPALARLEAEPFELNTADRQTISLYLAFQDSRTPAGNRRTQGVSQTVLELEAATWLGSEEGFLRWHRQHVPSQESDAEIERRRQRMLGQLRAGAVRFQQPRAQAYRMMLNTLNDVATHIYALSWVLLEVPGDVDAEFVLGDRGLAMVDPAPTHPWTGNSWSSSDAAETVIPLGPRAALLVTPGPPTIARQPVEADEVLQLNLRAYGWSERFVFGRTQKLVTDLHRTAKRRRREVPTPRGPSQVVIAEADPNDPTVGQHNVRRGWPRGIWSDDDEGVPRFFDYTVLDTDTDTASETVPAALRAVERVSPQRRRSQDKLED
jgi:hypothetical protein